MKKSVHLFQPDSEGDQWRKMLLRLGFEPKVHAGVDSLFALCQRRKSEVLLADRSLLSAVWTAALERALCLWTTQVGTVALTGPAVALNLPFAVEDLGETCDPLVLNDVFLRCLPDYSRQYPRMETRLPGLLWLAKDSYCCDILSIGRGGAFLKTGVTLPPLGTQILLHVALLGMRKELEFKADVVRHVIPCECNNYLQGFGVRFADADGDRLEDLCNYLKNKAMEELTPPGQIDYSLDAVGSMVTTGHASIAVTVDSCKRKRRVTAIY